MRGSTVFTMSVSDNVNTLVWEQSQDHARCSDSATDYQILTYYRHPFDSVEHC